MRFWPTEWEIRGGPDGGHYLGCVRHQDDEWRIEVILNAESAAVDWERFYNEVKRLMKEEE